jgi:hypothetical protein
VPTWEITCGFDPIAATEQFKQRQVSWNILPGTGCGASAPSACSCVFGRSTYSDCTSSCLRVRDSETFCTLRFGIGYHRSFPIEWRFWAGSIMGCLCTIICNIFRDSLGELIMTRAPRYQGCSKTMSDVSSLQHLVQVVSVTVLRLVRCLWLDEWKSVLHQL